MRLIDKKLSDRQEKFAQEIAENGGRISGTEAAMLAGYPKASAYQRAYELQNPEICPHVVKRIREIRLELSKKYEISKDNHMEELWRIREDAKNKDNQMVRLRAEEDRGKMMGYYIEKKAILNVNKRPIDDMSLPELYKEMERIKKRNRHFMEKTKNEKNKKK
tara:strand:+ start:365 stop:853 length:489 start_codon:yes stop_codon:yes gene_type:complete